LWLGNLHQRLPRSVLRSVFERYGPVDDVVTFPGRMYAFVNFKEPADAAHAAEAVQVGAACVTHHATLGLRRCVRMWLSRCCCSVTP
jgi:hypothetical protein